jgi:mono/diheme cytochrome c family protein
MIALFTLAASLVVAANVSPQPATPPLVPQPSVRSAGGDKVKLGGELYAVHCISCHGATLQGSADGPSLI